MSQLWDSNPRPSRYECDALPTKLNWPAYTFSGAVANLYESNYNLAYSAVGYLTITVGDLSVTFYSDYIEQDHSRTIAFVAWTAYTDRADVQSEDYPYYVDKEGNYSPYSNSSLDKIKAFADAYKE